MFTKKEKYVIALVTLIGILWILIALLVPCKASALSVPHEKTFAFWQRDDTYSTYIQIVSLQDDTQITLTFYSACGRPFVQELGLSKAKQLIYFDTSFNTPLYGVGWGTIVSNKPIVAIVQVYSDLSVSTIPLTVTTLEGD